MRTIDAPARTSPGPTTNRGPRKPATILPIGGIATDTSRYPLEIRIVRAGMGPRVAKEVDPGQHSGETLMLRGRIHRRGVLTPAARLRVG